MEALLANVMSCQPWCRWLCVCVCVSVCLCMDGMYIGVMATVSQTSGMESLILIRLATDSSGSQDEFRVGVYEIVCTFDGIEQSVGEKQRRK